jgi:hypothetical protein
MTGSTATNHTNRFAVLADDYAEKPIINTSKPAINAPKLAPATLASITSVGPKVSFTSKFAEHIKSANDPNYKPAAKPINFESKNEFPSLGGNGSTATNVIVTKPSGTKFADLAKKWAKDEEAALKIVANKANKASEASEASEALSYHNSIQLIPNIIRSRRLNTEYKSNKEDENYEESSLGGDDSDEVPEGEIEPSDDDDDENQDEFNGDLGWDGRKRGDIY